MKLRSLAWVGVLLVAAPAAGRAQSAQALSIQVSGLYAGLFGNAYAFLKDGFGAEAQLRYTPSRLSIGGGLQWTRHSTQITSVPMSLFGIFIEPRYVIPVNSSSMAPYLSLRMSVLKQRISDDRYSGSSSGLTGNVGAGLLFRLGSRVNLDAGASFGYTTFGDLTITDNSDGSTSSGPGGSGSNLVGRLGFAFGI
jgi:hypothetical protein